MSSLGGATPATPAVGVIGPDIATDAVTAVLGDLANVVGIDPAGDMEGVLDDLDAVVDASARAPLTADVLASAQRLKMVSLASTGSSHVDTDVAEARGIEIRTLREDADLLRGLTPAAELTWALVLACARHLPAAVAHVRDGGWERERFPGTMLKGRRLGLIGCGRIGAWVGRYGAAFGMDVVGHDPHVERWPDGIEPAALDEVVEAADVLSVHVHLTDDTRGLLGADLLHRCKQGAIVVNTSRGGVVDETALLDALQSGRLGAAALDVLEFEPARDDDPLIAYARTHDNLLITPHIGGFSHDALVAVCRRAAEKVRAVLEAAP